MLRKSWENQLSFFKRLENTRVPEHGISNFIQWMLLNDYSKTFFAGSSMWQLLISKPTPNGKLNYQQTLSIQFDSRISCYKMKYSDWDIIDTEEDYEKATCWETTCIAIELVPKFLEFIHWNTKW
ncbi:hypothetical protein [Kordia jejudonensis]|uniref:hypothetical protein n=1 Tax=Kordia jejudonensis TaxID=1348245 RepID=UPI0012E0610E|nr:hypothetical protein [Kordia jejudonensis]